MSAALPQLASALLALLLWISPAHAVRPGEMLPNPSLEARAETIGHELRCLVCRNQSIEDSEADLAHDLRVVVRDRLKAGDTDQQVIDYIHSRYGDFVLLRPPFQADTLLLWGGPALVLVLGGLVLVRFFRKRRTLPVPPPLTAEERQRLSLALGDGAER
jgi:cytochrome c-type biogenesis protein CcmH